MMNNNKLFILLYLLLLLLMFWMEFRASEITVESISNRDYRIDENPKLDEIFQEYQKPLGFNKMNVQWGIVIKKIKPKETVNLKDSDKNSLLEVIVKDKTLCIEKECFKLLGIFSSQDVSYATFYNKKSKKKVKTFMVGEILTSTIKIETIVRKKVLFKDINSSRMWHIKLFDVNSSKYKPKEFE